MEYVEAPTESEDDIRGGIGTTGFGGVSMLTGRWVGIGTGEDCCDVKREVEYPVASSKITSELSVTLLVSGFQKRQPLLVAL